MNRTSWARWAAALASGSLAALLALRSDAGDVTTSLPHGFWLGAPRGPASAREVDASGSRHATALPEPEAARVAWQRRIAGGASGNVLVVNGGNTNVYIYNCGAKGVTVLPSTGTGGAGSSWPLTGWSMALLAVALLAGGMTLKPVVARRGR